ncbi:hypothetical protein BDV95DRAFT_607945 [Massariosphaeria phaeospora]|uniref:Maintenance of telomere capping protein 6 n=1 Tax=Massariosphaeria phaeospora TaxID=100035 RepID=A0A7C8MAZ2_9PLEO|nr:hypothetical protein BDV95DRAFT_607945 [Massariosphaeria phaeospora]
MSSTIKETQRDVGLRVPINYLTVPAASLSSACFGHNQYENAAFQKCFSNLLAVGFRRFQVDVYWDPTRSVWSLCPVEVPPHAEQVSSTVAAAAISITPEQPRPSDLSLLFTSETTLPTSSPVEGGNNARPRQEESLFSSSIQPSAVLSDVPSSTVSHISMLSSTAAKTASPSIINENNVLMQIGNYKCTSEMTLDFLTGVFNDFVDKTATTTDALFTFLILNIHSAASSTASDAPAQQPPSGQLPNSSHLITNIFQRNLTEELYTSQMLREDREKLNRTWLDGAWNTLPAAGYYQTSVGSNGNLVTQDGWPTEAYVEFKKYHRLVVSFGSMDPQMAEYNLEPELSTIFALGTFLEYRNTTFNTAGSVTSGCIFSPSEDTITPNTNSSWALSVVPNLDLAADPDKLSPIPAVTNLTSCGISPWTNSTLSGATADQNVAPYAAFVYSTLWTWAPGQPLNASASEGSQKDRCAVMDTIRYPGRWQTADCDSQHRAACQDPANPYRWDISFSTASYPASETACPPGLVFSVPHTALENAHLLSAIRAHPSTQHRDTTEPVFLNLNSLDVQDCWVLEVNGTCPYDPPTDTNRLRIVVVPTVAAVIIFVCAALTFFVKCAANRREDKRGRRRRNVGGWDYEGVPS